MITSDPGPDCIGLKYGYIPEAIASLALVKFLHFVNRSTFGSSLFIDANYSADVWPI
jgi:hypothetical protein